jgi:hypothetical protein
MPSPRTFALALLAALLPAPALAQADAPTPAADAAAASLEGDLETLSLLAATAALVRERTGAYPATAFQLLSSPEADRTGARGLVLSGLTLAPSGDALEVRYGRTPTAEDPTERGAAFTLAPDAEAGGYAARFTLSRTADRDFGGRRLDFANEGDLRVVNARGRLCLDLGRMAALSTRAAWAAAAPYLGPREALSVAFDATGGGRRVANATLPTAAD